MSQKTERRIAFGLCLLVALGTVAPYAVAIQAARPNTFTGFLINPVDGFSYLAKMRQGAEGEWLFRLPYAPNPGSAAFLYGYYIFLGHVADFLQIPLITLFHAARFLAGIGLFWLGFYFFKTFLQNKFETWAAFLLSLFGAGMGWIFGLLGIQTSDLSIPESIPFQTAYTNAHFPLANLLLLGAVLAIVKEGSLRKRVLVAGVCGLLLAIVLPFSLASLFVFLILWLVWESDILLHKQNWRGAWRNNRARFTSFLALAVGAGPFLLYDLWLTKNHPVIAQWTQQNQTPSPPISAYLIGYSPVLLLAIAAAVRRESRSSARGRLLIVWSVSNFLFLYAPFDLQRRLSLGLYFPLACLAAIGLNTIVSNPARRRLLLIAAILITFPSNLVVVLTGIDRVNRSDPNFIYRPGEVADYWLLNLIPHGSLILAAPDTGNRLPAFADVRVLYGHPFETPDAGPQEALIDELFRWDGPGDVGFERLISLDVDYVYYGWRERSIGSPTWLSLCTTVFVGHDVRILRVDDS
jgi:hypothetical protein